MYTELPGNVCASKTVDDGCTKTRPFSWLKYLIVLASGSSSTAPEIDGANFLSGKSMRAICGLKAEAIRDLRRVLLLMFWLREGDRLEGRKDSSRRDEMNWTRLEEMSESV